MGRRRHWHDAERVRSPHVDNRTVLTCAAVAVRSGCAEAGQTLVAGVELGGVDEAVDVSRVGQVVLQVLDRALFRTVQWATSERTQAWAAHTIRGRKGIREGQALRGMDWLDASCSERTLPVTIACTKKPNTENIARRPFLISFTCNASSEAP